LLELDARPIRASNEGVFDLDASILVAPFMNLKSTAGFIDLLNRTPGIESFDALRQRAEKFLVEGQIVYVACVDDLLTLKRNSTRQKDIDHVHELESIKSLGQLP
jgi:hypothetical protein